MYIYIYIYIYVYIYAVYLLLVPWSVEVFFQRASFRPDALCCCVQDFQFHDISKCISVLQIFNKWIVKRTKIHSFQQPVLRLKCAFSTPWLHPRLCTVTLSPRCVWGCAHWLVCVWLGMCMCGWAHDYHGVPVQVVTGGTRSEPPSKIHGKEKKTRRSSPRGRGTILCRARER